MSEPAVITPLPDHDSLRGIFEINCAYKFEKANSIEWHCSSTHSKYEFVVILFHLGYIRVKIGETEHDVTFGDSVYVVGVVESEAGIAGETSRLSDILLNKTKINIHDILTFMEWNYHIGYV